MMVQRRFPRWSELRPLMRLRLGERDAVSRRLRRAHDLDDLYAIARGRVPPAVLGYVDGGADDEITLRAARDAFARVRFHPHVLRDVSSVDISTTILGRPSRLPIIFGPTGFTRLIHHEGERAVVRAAERAGVPYVLSTMGTVSVAEVTAAAPIADVWFQLYLWRDRARSKEFIDQAREAGVRTLMLTVDVPVGGARLRDLRTGFTVPPALTPRTMLQLARFPAWWLNLLTTEPLRFASLGGGPASPVDLIASTFDPRVTLDDMAWLRETWDGALVVKGVNRADDARSIVAAGADAIVVSNHGGRQLDRVPPALELLPGIAEAVGDRVEVLLDGGVRSGADVAAAVAGGARACLLGRAYLYGLIAGGEQGVGRVVELFSNQLRRTMQLLGVTSVAELGPELVTW